MVKFDRFESGQIAHNRKIFLSKEELNRLYLKENLTSGQIAKKYSVDYTTILNWLKHYGIPIKKIGNQWKKFSLTREELYDLYHNKNLSIEKICKKIELSPGSLHRWMKIYDIPRRTLSELKSGKNNPAYKNGLPNCIDCGKELSNYNNKRCQPCFHKWMTGENHPQYRGIGRPPYPLEFDGKLKAKIRKRDHYTCQECGKKRKELGYKPHVHHIDFDKNNNDPNNLICLCRKCHGEVHLTKEDWIDHFRQKLLNPPRQKDN